ncbi:hypothetical protein BOC42_37930 [Burkholderia pseudomallei]|nr:hypothetical protein BOC42_37930 [Burkholderia pseudomallei]ARL05305.1 hypothetical protein BOC44_27250 [Burkholderia pseudomallei]ARL13045.1 hypothetical protein BOC45_31525 [Burkholderia pseudomallei]NRE49891.1 hypothetical protein [Burkholderia pseudomallei]OSP91092.1 hypothetical protein BOC41_24160 [Burkholderia pseudomallei]
MNRYRAPSAPSAPSRATIAPLRVQRRASAPHIAPRQSRCSARRPPARAFAPTHSGRLAPGGPARRAAYPAGSSAPSA